MAAQGLDHPGLSGEPGVEGAVPGGGLPQDGRIHIDALELLALRGGGATMPSRSGRTLPSSSLMWPPPAHSWRDRSVLPRRLRNCPVGILRRGDGPGAVPTPKHTL